MSTLTQAPGVSIPSGTWSIDASHSTVEFEVSHMRLARVTGRAPVVAGSIVGGDAPSVQGTVDARALTTFDESRDEHLRSPEFFDVERFPELRFSSTAIEVADGSLVVEGDLTMRGVTRPVTLRGTLVGVGVDPWGNDRLGLELEGTVDRTGFGMEWNAPLPGGGFLLPRDVVLSASFSALREA